MSTPVNIVRRFYDALGRGDVPAALSLLDPQVEWTEAERFPYYGGTWHGPQAVLDNLLKRLPGDWDGFSVKAQSQPKVTAWFRSGPIPERSRKPDDYFRPSSPTCGQYAATSSQGSTCTPIPPRCSKRCRIECLSLASNCAFGPASGYTLGSEEARLPRGCGARFSFDWIRSLRRP